MWCVVASRNCSQTAKTASNKPVRLDSTHVSPRDQRERSQYSDSFWLNLCGLFTEFSVSPASRQELCYCWWKKLLFLILLLHDESFKLNKMTFVVKNLKKINPDIFAIYDIYQYCFKSDFYNEVNVWLSSNMIYRFDMHFMTDMYVLWASVVLWLDQPGFVFWYKHFWMSWSRANVS